MYKRVPSGWTCFAAVLCLMSVACASRPAATQVRGAQAGSVSLPGIAKCIQEPAPSLTLDERPLTVIVHGCFSKGARFSSLATALQSRGQQVLCYDYDDRESLHRSARRLRGNLIELTRLKPGNAPITVVGHSQGGLVGRLALAELEHLPPLTGSFRLITASAPLNGIAAAAHCGLVSLHVTSLGLTMGICQAVTGSKWPQIHQRSRLVTDPPELSPAVERHVALMTDERGTCERVSDAGRCVKDDYVFSLSEQFNPRMAWDERTSFEQVKAGHVEIVGESRPLSPKLFAALDKYELFGAPAGPEEPVLGAPRLEERVVSR